MSTLDDLNAALGEAIADYEADNETSADEVFYDLVISVVMTFILYTYPSKETRHTAREFCRTQLGYIPQYLEPFLGEAEWLDA